MTEQHTPLSAAEIAAVRRPYRAASLLPGRAYHDPDTFAFEQREWFGRDWILVGREADVAGPGSYRLVDLDGESIVLVRDRAGVLRAFYNVCRHRGTAVVEAECGTAVRFQCPYHAWIYDLDGRLARAKHTDDLEDFSREAFSLAPVRLETWQGFVFLSLAPHGESLTGQLGDLVDQLSPLDLRALVGVHRETYDVAANWKLIAENYSECYHCPSLHPQLNRLTPYDLGGDFEPNGAWQGGWMELVGAAETMSMDGGRRGRAVLPGISAADERCVFYYLVWPNAFLSVHPDYVLVHRLEPREPGRTTVVCDWLFDPVTAASPGFDPADTIAFWDLTNRQDWHVCELQQRGTASRSWSAGRYATNEPSVHAFDQMIVDRYASDGTTSRRTVRLRYDVPPPKDGDPAPERAAETRARRPVRGRRAIAGG
jgi:Rieske 2Fe-2S family protein